MNGSYLLVFISTYTPFKIHRVGEVYLMVLQVLCKMTVHTTLYSQCTVYHYYKVNSSKEIVSIGTGLKLTLELDQLYRLNHCAFPCARVL